VTKLMRMDALIEPLALAPVRDSLLDCAHAQWAATAADEDAKLVIGGEFAVQLSPAIESGQGVASDRYQALPATLAHDPHQTLCWVKAVPGQAGQLADSQAGCIEQLEHGPVPRGQFVFLGYVEQGQHLLDVERSGKFAPDPRCADPGRGINPRQPALAQVFEKPSQGGQTPLHAPRAQAASMFGRREGTDVSFDQTLRSFDSAFAGPFPEAEQVSAVTVHGGRTEPKLVAGVAAETADRFFERDRCWIGGLFRRACDAPLRARRACIVWSFPRVPGTECPCPGGSEPRPLLRLPGHRRR